MNIKALITFLVIDELIYIKLKPRFLKKLEYLEKQEKITSFSMHEDTNSISYDMVPKLRNDHTIRIFLKKVVSFDDVAEGSAILKIDDVILGWNLAEKKIDEQLYGYEAEASIENLLNFMKTEGENEIANPTDELKKLAEESKAEYTPLARVLNFYRTLDEDDKNGVDYWIDFIDVLGVRHNKIPLQVKSSLKRLHEHKKKYPNVPGISMPKEYVLESGIACIKNICNAYIQGEIFLLEIEKKKNEDLETEKSLTHE